MRSEPREISIFRIFGIPIRIDASWLIILAVLTLSLSSLFAAESPNRPALEYWAAALIGSLLFFGSILAHEISHSVVARARGTPVHGITLFVFGGVSKLGGEPKRPRDEFLIAVVGPISSALIGGLFFLASTVLETGGLLRVAAEWMGRANIALAVFNLLPGFPLDGGRILRSVVWAFTGSFQEATRVAAMAGSGIAYALIFFGAAIVFLFGAVFNGLWLGFIGMFLLSAARSHLQQMDLTGILSKMIVADTMQTDCQRVSEDLSVRELVVEHILKTGQKCCLVSDETALRGLVTLHEVKQISANAWDDTAVKEIMIPFEQLETLAPTDSLLEALQRMDATGVNQLPVVEGNELRGVMTRENVLHRVALNLELRPLVRETSAPRETIHASR